ncbi:MAG TPA: hypothetical protein VG892_04590 [Terriglobales bacterium]|nr:hypothetical protein [Terriglobales bacterium]
MAGVKLYLAERRQGNVIHDDELVKFMNRSSTCRTSKAHWPLQ